MIENVPSADELRTISLRLYFKAWSDLSAVLTEWSEFNTLKMPDWISEKGHFYIETAEQAALNDTQEWREYLEAAQNDLQAIYTLIQQSQEIGLKAKICDVSPFLLLKRTDVAASDPRASRWDFTDFPTIDASELVRVHNTFCDSALSKDFQKNYEQIRRNRNKISHLGIYNQRIDPPYLIDVMLLHFVELYPDRRWMDDRLHFATLHRLADYADHDFNERTGLLIELWHLLPGLSDPQFKRIMGHERKDPRYICHFCADDANLGGHPPYDNDIATAYRTGEEMTVRCAICNKSYAIAEGHCPRDDCECTLLSAEIDSQGECMECGWSVQDVNDHRERQDAQRHLFNSPKTK